MPSTSRPAARHHSDSGGETVARYIRAAAANAQANTSKKERPLRTSIFRASAEATAIPNARLRK
jgi:hypothetical protein